MKTLLKISWRNIWRNKARSIVIILAVGFGLWGGIFATALINGMMKQQFESGIRHQVSHIQIHHPDYVTEKQIEHSIDQWDEIEDYLQQSPNVIAWSSRTLSNGMLANASMTSGVDIYGIDKEQEHTTTAFKETIIEGDYFESVTSNAILIGSALADKMKIKTANRIVVTFQDYHGDITSAAFRVCGIYRTSNSTNDLKNVYVRQAELTELAGKSNLINEIAILLDDIDHVNAFRDQLKSKFPAYEIRTWAEISPDLAFMTEFSGIALMVLLIIILFALAFGLLNTMLMTIFERTRELGVLMSVGMNKTKVFTMILLETSFLIITGALFGSAVGSVTVFLTGKKGLDLTSMGADTMSEFGFDPVIYPQLEQMFYVNLALLVLMTAILASLYPAWKALRLKPAEAVRKE